MVALRKVDKVASHCVVSIHQPSATFLTNKKQIEIILRFLSKLCVLCFHHSTKLVLTKSDVNNLYKQVALQVSERILIKNFQLLYLIFEGVDCSYYFREARSSACFKLQISMHISLFMLLVATFVLQSICTLFGGCDLLHNAVLNGKLVNCVLYTQK